MATPGTELEFLPSAANFEESHYTNPSTTSTSTPSYLQGSKFAWLLAEESPEDEDENRPLL